MPGINKENHFKEAGWLQRSRPVHRFILALTAGLFVFTIMPGDLPLVFKLVVGWLGFCITYTAICWFIIFNMPVEFIKAKANEEDGGRVYVFALILLATLAGLFAVLILVISKHQIAQHISVPITVGSMLLSWFMVHTIFVFHYAHMYYTEGAKNEGLDFPGSKEVDYLDFAYFSFGVGCTFQVADVGISSKAIRRTVFFHSLLSFLLNTYVVALTINIIAGLMN